MKVFRPVNLRTGLLKNTSFYFEKFQIYPWIKIRQPNNIKNLKDESSEYI